MMSRSQVPFLTGFVLLGMVVVWQFQRISELERSTAGLLARDAASAPTGSHGSGPGNSGGETSRGDLRSSSPDGPPPDGPPERGKRRNPEREANMRALRELDRKQRQDAQILALTTKLHLTPEQQTAIRAALDKGSAERDALREAGFARHQAGGGGDSEEARRADLAKFAAVNAAQEQSIASGLSAEQLAAYTDYKTEQKQTSIENKANQELGDLLKNFSLSEDQKDAAFQFFAGQAKDNPFDPDRIAAMGGDIRKIFEQQQKSKLEAFKRILTPAQYELYNTQQEQRAATFRNLTPGAGQGPGPGAGQGMDFGPQTGSGAPPPD
jgi:hypothetical protein